MKRIYLLLLLACCQSFSFSQIIDRMQQPVLAYPETRKSDVIHDYFGAKVPDPYQWLENDRSSETKQWVKNQNQVTQFYLDKIPSKEKIRNRLEQLMDYPRLSSPLRAGDYYFFTKNNGLQNQGVIYKQKGETGEPEVFINPNEINPAGTTSISIASISDDNKYAVIRMNEAGSDWSTFNVIDIESGEKLKDELSWIKFSNASWDENGFYYSRYPETSSSSKFSGTNLNHAVYYHTLGQDQSKDVLVYEDIENTHLYHWAELTEDNAYLILYASTGTDGFECMYKKNKSKSAFRKLFYGFNNKSSVVDYREGMFLIHTNIDAPNYRMIAVKPEDPRPKKWREVIPEKEHLLESVTKAGGKYYAKYLENAFNKVYEIEFGSNTAREIKLPGIGTIDGFSGKLNDRKVFFGYTSFDSPYTLFEYDLETSSTRVFYQPELRFLPENFQTKQVRYKSKDGTSISMFIFHKKGLELNGNNPTYLYEYGGFNVNMTPFFSSSNMVLLENGGVFAMPNLRGGGEYGEDWHRAGMAYKKQNVFDDFIAAAEYLIEQKYTRKEKLAIAGGSNGGLLVGACMTQRPDLFRVALPAVGVMDMLRYHKFTVGWGWIPEYGCSDSSKMSFKNLKTYSPLHNLKDGEEYPCTLITTADHDDRVVPAHSFKFAARLQEAHKGSNPVLIHIETNAGHGAGKPISKIIEQEANKWAFMFLNTKSKINY